MPPTNAMSNQQSSSPTSPISAQKKEPQEQLRPPLYNAEDYASALRALFTNSLSLPSSAHHHQPTPTSLILEHASTHPPLIPGQGLIDMTKHNNKAPQQQEMSMKKFINGSELLFKLEADLRSAFPSFTQEFVSGDSEGVGCILDALRTVHEALDHVNGLREQRKLVLDERSCVQCLHLMTTKNLDAIQKLLTYPHGLYPIVHCTVSTNTSTRILSLEILTSICEQGGGDAFAKVSEAISTLRLRLGEPIRCKVLVGAIASAAAGVFQATGVRFLRSYVAAAPSAKFRVYLQVELEEAGFHVEVIRKSAELSPVRESRLVIQELDEWDRVVVDVDTVVRQNSQLRNSVATLQQEIATLKDRIKKQEPLQQHQQQHQQQQHHSKPPTTKFTKKKSQQQQQARQLASTPIQTITTPVDSEEEAEQIHQILEDLHNIVNNEMLQQSNENSSSGGSNTTNMSSSSSSEIVPVLNSRPGLMRGNSRIVHSEPNLFGGDGGESSYSDETVTDGGGGGGRVKDVVMQLENSNVLFNTLPNFNTGGLASKFANFKSSKLDGLGKGGGGNGWVDSGSDPMEQCPVRNSRVKSLENLDNFTLKWKYPVVGESGGSSSSSPKAPQPTPLNVLPGQPNSLVVLQDYRMNRFGGNNNKTRNKERNNSPPVSSTSSGGGVAGLFSKNKKKHLVQHPQKTFQISLISGGGAGGKNDGGKVTNLSFNDLGSGGGGGGGGASGSSGNSPSLLERVTDLPSGLY